MGILQVLYCEDIVSNNGTTAELSVFSDQMTEKGYCFFAFQITENGKHWRFLWIAKRWDDFLPFMAKVKGQWKIRRIDCKMYAIDHAKRVKEQIVNF